MSDEMYRRALNEEEIARMKEELKAAEEARFAPYKALRRRMDAGLRYAVANDAVSDEELLTMSAATMEWKPGITLNKGDTVMNKGDMYVYIGENRYTTLVGHEPGTATQAIYRRVKREGSNEWQPDTDYIGKNNIEGKEPDEVVFDGVTYICQLTHTSQIGWEPPNVPAIWAKKNE